MKITQVILLTAIVALLGVPIIYQLAQNKKSNLNSADCLKCDEADFNGVSFHYVENLCDDSYSFSVKVLSSGDVYDYQTTCLKNGDKFPLNSFSDFYLLQEDQLKC
ncbi:transmembrane protein, putative (macronuclear) [Tetrahymena thermophila SB210]|uniref:Transmembrane protein, putative n=1 Tax=Tetrahymena thermophila (strain SB210) TaxID=312017 RepID=Q23BP2_TETTS|nr:transmembrane protein, putative [Tetrahymena thermophila SB210]EAR94076.1 transmembrane protein, putative [Tetrahymena thermophila SB210]|eukprot:XP_001014321.1 transmembrane protein, putative [Tetrahymena thermophila SB210]